MSHALEFKDMCLIRGSFLGDSASMSIICEMHIFKVVVGRVDITQCSVEQTLLDKLSDHSLEMIL